MTRTINANDRVKLRSGNTMPVIGLGTWKLTGGNALRAVSEALKIGYRLVDTASDYGNFPEIRTAIQNSDVPRGDMFVTTKVEETDNAYEAAKEYVGQLGLDYADLIIIHRPPVTGAGEELWRGLMKARDVGITKDIGVSNYSIELIEALFDDSNEWPAVNQIEWTPFGYSKDMLNFCQKNNIAIQAYSPLMHTGEVNQELIEDLAKKYGKTPAQIVLRWGIQQGVVPIPKATSRMHLEENIDIFDFELSKEDTGKLDSLNQYYSALGSSLIYV